MRAKVVSRGIAVEKTTLVPNWADTDLIFPRPRTNPWNASDLEDKLAVVMYSGNLRAITQNLDQLLDVAPRKFRDRPVRFVVVGEERGEKID